MKKLALIPLLGLLLAFPFAQAQTQDGPALLEALRAGGQVIVMRHASSPRQEPDAASANPDNVDRERQLDATGRADATAMGEALRRNGIVITSIHSSPTYRALETARLMGFDNAQTHEELGNEGMADSSEARGVWLRERTAEAPAEGNALYITHAPNMNAAFGEQASGMGEGDALVFTVNEAGEAMLLGRMKVADWSAL